MSIRYYNRSAPFWDWVASMEEQGRDHPWFSGNHERAEGAAEHDEEQQQHQQQPGNAWQGFWPFGNMPHRGRFGPPPPPHGEQEGEKGPAHDGQDPPPPFPGDDAEDPPEEAPEAGPSHHRGPPHGRRGGPGRHGHGHGPGHSHAHAHGRGGWGGWGMRGRGGRCGGRRGGFPMGPFAFGGLGNMFEEQLFGGENGEKSEDFKPDVDVFDTPEAFVIHVSLPGAKKEDVGVDWNADKSELSIAGVTYRPNADEEFLKTLALDERKVGAFERKVRLGSRANPAQVDVDGITAKLEDGILRVEVPKLNGGFVDIKKVDVE